MEQIIIQVSKYIIIILMAIYTFQCFAVFRFGNVCVIQEEIEGEALYPVEDGFAYPVIYSSNYTVLYERSNGVRVIADSTQCRKHSRIS